jgi:hypothetical protein
MLPETRCIATKALLDTFPDDPNTNVHVGAFRSQRSALMSRDPISLGCFDRWNRERSLGSLLWRCDPSCDRDHAFMTMQD